MDGIPQLKAFRAAADLTQQAAAKRAKVARETWARWETGAIRIDENRLPAISEMTGIPKRDLRPDLAEVMREAAE